MPLAYRLEQFFEFERLGATWRKEALAGMTTFVTMAYIILVNPLILRQTGMPVAAVTLATCLCAGLASILMGILARYPIALAPGMGLNAYFTFTVVKGLGIPWRTALAAVFLSGILFLLLTASGFRQRLVNAVPHSLYSAVAAGIGLFIALIGFHNAGIIVGTPETLIGLGNLRSPDALVCEVGLLATALLLVRRVKAAILLGIAISTAFALIIGETHWQFVSLDLRQISGTAFQLDFSGLLRLGLWEIIFVFAFVDLFDNLGTLVGVTRKLSYESKGRQLPRVGRILFADAIATVLGALLGTSTVTSYVESAAGIAVGGRTGVTAIITGILFILSTFAIPLVSIVPEAATAPALILVGSLMMQSAADVPWHEPAEAIPAFLALACIPLTFSIATGLSAGFLAYAVLRLATGKLQRRDWLLYVMAALCLIRFIYLARL
jgi:adenine/guanine/hypoxanthine permease